MTQPDTSGFDEQAALAELERLQAAIQAARRQRMQVNDAFDTFVRSMREQRAGDAPPRMVRSNERPRTSVPAPAASPELEPAPAPPPRSAIAAASSLPASEADHPFESYSPGPARPGGRPRVQPRYVGIGAAVLALAVIGWMVSRGAPEAPAPVTQPDAAASAPAPSPAPTSVAQPATQAPAAPVQIELETIRPSWMRVIVDGERVVEREIPIGQKLRYSATREIVVRAGDAGAVRVRVRDGEPVPLGRDAFPATRTFRPAER